ncbi:MAG: methyltransferase domain-containing protein [Chloroflexi bacterium]|nr:methyltransferase domain-containing protein [Chloroflexota bacterium]
MTKHNEKVSVNDVCPNCCAATMRLFYEAYQVPVHSVLLLHDRETAVTFPTGQITLGFCQKCGFVSNTAFDAGKQDYAGEYEATQGFSPTFNAFHRRLASDLIERFDLRGKHVVEIGCGMGEFLHLLCEMGDNTGTGFDPAYVRERSMIGDTDKINFIADYFSEKYVDTPGDFFACKMTLEHIPNTAEFVGMVRRTVGDDPGKVVFFQVPNARYVFGDVAFWDVYYEHCSYFSLGSIARMFRDVGFDAVDLWTDYDDQYLMIAARPGNGDNPRLPQEDDLAEMAADVAHFTAQFGKLVDDWRRQFDAYKKDGRRVVIWGGGSKAVSFLTALGIGLDDVQYVVDINPNKTGAFMAGTGQEIVAPQFLPEYQPDAVIVMNPVYRDEIQRDLEEMGLSPQLLTV